MQVIKIDKSENKKELRILKKVEFCILQMIKLDKTVSDIKIFELAEHCFNFRKLQSPLSLIKEYNFPDSKMFQICIYVCF